MVSAGVYHTCGIRTDGALLCWGANGNGYLGDGTNTARLTPTPIFGGGSWKSVSAGGNQTCGIRSDDKLYCWGLNSNGQLGDGTTGQSFFPVEVVGGQGWLSVSSGTGYTCGIRLDKVLHCWGLNTNGRLGDGTLTQRLVPTPVNGGGKWSIVSTGKSPSLPHTCAVGDGSVNNLYCWGSNSSGAMTASKYSSPYHLTGVSTFCGAPSGKPGAILYNADANALQYCDGVGWVRVGR